MTEDKRAWNGCPENWGIYRDREWSKHVLLCRERHVKDLNRIGDPEFPFYFDWDASQLAVDFFRELRHFDSPWTGQRFELADWQEWDIVRPLFGWKRLDGTRRFRFAYIEIPRKNGKALSLDTEIPTPNGFKTIKEISSGDKVFNRMGEPVSVISVSEVFEDRDCYELTFSTGETIKADSKHQWIVGCSDWGSEMTVETDDLKVIFDQKNKSENRIYVPNAPAFLGEERKLPIEPYLLGIWLGDGDSDTARITTADDQVVQILESKGFKVSHRGNYRYLVQTTTGPNLSSTLRGMKLLKNKHIPEEFMFASIEQRLELLKGLLDSDGTIGKNGQVEFCSTSESLALQVRSLARGLGLKATIREADAHINGRVVSKKYRVFFYPDRGMRVFGLDRKAKRQRAVNSNRCSRNYITKIEKIKKQKTKCLTVDCPTGSFLASDGFVVTHNSPLATGIALYLLMADQEYGAQVYTAATKEDQARICYDYAEKMLRFSDLKRFFDITRKSIYCPELGSAYKPLGRDSKTQDGFSVHGAVVDEYHAHKTTGVLDVLTSARGARRQPLIVIITTAGFGTPPCKRESDVAKGILEGRLPNENYFAFISTMDEGDDWKDPAVWEKVNPNWGISLNPEGFEVEFQEAILSLEKQNSFKTKKLNLWTEQATRWISMEQYSKNDGEVDWSRFYGKPCVGGIDLGLTQDLSALALAFMGDKEEADKDGNIPVYLMVKYWVPEEGLRARYERDGLNYPAWAEEGWINVIPGAVTNVEFIRRDINELADKFALNKIYIDRAHASDLVVKLADDGFDMAKHHQGFVSMNFPCRSFEELILAGNLRHGNDPVLRWMVSNAAVAKDPADNIKVVKDKSGDRVDGVVAACMAIGGLLIEPEPHRSVYLDQGIYVG